MSKHTTLAERAAMLPTANEVLSEYFTAPTLDNWGDIYCTHLFAQLGPCPECDSEAYLRYCDEEWAEHQREHGVLAPGPDGDDTRWRDVPVEGGSDGWHLVLVDRSQPHIVLHLPVGATLADPRPDDPGWYLQPVYRR